MMITGDYHHTAVAVARDLGMLKPQDSVMVIDIAMEAQLPQNPSLLTSLSPQALAWPALSERKMAAQQALDVNHCMSQTQHMRLTSVSTGASKQGKWDGASEGEADRAEAASLLSSQMMAKRKLALLQVPLHCDNAGPDPGLDGPPQVPSRLMSPNGLWSVPVRLKHPVSPLQTPSSNDGSPKSMCGQSPPMLVTPGVPGSSLEGLTFQPLAGVRALNPSDALAALAEGQMQSAVTGDAFEHLLQHHDLSVLETVLRSTVVFSRMQPHQKGQVMDLLGSRGIHQLFAGQLRHIQVRLLPTYTLLSWFLHVHLTDSLPKRSPAR